VTGALLANVPVADLTVEDPPIEEVIERVFAGGPDSAGTHAPKDEAVAAPEAVPV
jgi:hypothetical protein